MLYFLLFRFLFLIARTFCLHKLKIKLKIQLASHKMKWIKSIIAPEYHSSDWTWLLNGDYGDCKGNRSPWSMYFLKYRRPLLNEVTTKHRFDTKWCKIFNNYNTVSIQHDIKKSNVYFLQLIYVQTVSVQKRRKFIYLFFKIWIFSLNLANIPM